MCVVFFAIDCVPKFHLILASNRDEFYARPTQSLQLWEDGLVYAGKDIEKGGTWLGATKTGRFAFITNFRDPSEFTRQAKSRGNLVSDFLKDDIRSLQYLKTIESVMHDYNGFNLVVSDGKECYYLSNRKKHAEKLEPGFYGLSNALLDSNWPKQISGKKALIEQVKKNPDSVESYFTLLHNTQKAKDCLLPDTGIGQKRERILSSLYIESPNYGTKSSSLLFIKTNGEKQMIERNWNVDHDETTPVYTQKKVCF